MLAARERKSIHAPARLDALDGFRSLVMLMVALCHLHLLGLGWIGVPGFFVLSGFLITKVLLVERDRAPNAVEYLKRFYCRRALRIFPIYYFYLIVVLAGSLLVPRIAGVQNYLPSALLYYYNYFSVYADPHHSRLLNHLWSLSVEEQFYIVWPLVIWLAPRPQLKWIMLALVVLGPAIRFATSFGSSLGFSMAPGVVPAQGVYLLTTSHIDAFALGALINMVKYRPAAWQLFATLGTCLLLGMLVNAGEPRAVPLVLGWPLAIPHGWQWVWGYSLINLLWFEMICAIRSGGRLADVFSSKPLVFVGRRSYSAYILHFPLLALFAPLLKWAVANTDSQLIGTLVIMPPYLAMLMGLSHLTYVYVERPFLLLKDRLWASDASSGRGQWKTAESSVGQHAV